VSRRSAPVLAALFALLAVLVAAGAFTGLDQWSIDHLMPGVTFDNEERSRWLSLLPIAGSDLSTGSRIAVNIVALPASFLVALALVAWRSRILAAALVACVAVEVLCKEVLVRPELHQGALHIEAFDSSFPSGHALRTVLVAVAFWPLLRWWCVAWAAASVVLLEVAGWHTPSDLAGGVTLGLLGGAAAGALRARRLRAAP